MLPTLVTLGNLFSGFLAIAYLTDSLGVDPASSQAEAQRILLYEKSIFLIFLAMVFDTLDGLVARLTKQASGFGAQVDSICDVISFGAAPALLFKVVAESHPQMIAPRLAQTLAVIFLACGVLRLARFNLETDQKEESHRFFEGLPIPAAAAVVASLVHLNLVLDPEHADHFVRHLLPWLMPVLAFLMVSRIPYLHMGTFLARRRAFSFLVLTIFLLTFGILLLDWTLPAVCGLYMLSGPLVWLFRRGKQPRNPMREEEMAGEGAP